MAEVFISYARADQAMARRVADGLKARGFEVWWDDQLPAHRAYSEIIEQRLHDAKAVVVLWSGDAAKSQWVRAEADYARNAGKLVQAQLSAALPPMPFNQIQCADLRGWRGKADHTGFSKLAASVGALVSGEEIAAAAEPTAPSRWAWIDARWAAAAAILLLVAAAFLLTRFISSGEASRPILAVLPFESLDQRDSSLVAGIWEDTRQALSRNPKLLVLGPNTSEQLAKDPETASKAADYLVEANVRSVGDRIRVSANLVRTDDGAQMWSESFERRLDDVFQLQQEIAGEIEGRIRGRLAERGGTLPEHIVTSGEVYALYSDARITVRKRMGGFEKAQEQLERVVKMDPNFAPGWATLAVVKAFFGPPTGENSAAEAYARRAIALAPNLAAGHAALGFTLGRQGPAAKAALERALELDPNDIEAMNWLANVYATEGDGEAAVRLYDQILEIEPLWWTAVVNKTSQLIKKGDMAAAEQDIARLEKRGNPFAATYIKMELARKRGDLSTAVNLGLGRYDAAPAEERKVIGPLLFAPLAQLQMFDVMDRLAPPPTQWIPYIRRNDPKAIEMFEAEFEPKEFWTFGYLGIMGARLYLLNNQAQRLARQYHAAANSAEEFAELVGTPQIAEIAPIVALALKQTGEDAEAQRLLDLAVANKDEPAESPEYAQVRLARIYAVQGRKDEAIGLLSSAVQRGWLPPHLPIPVDLAIDPPLAQLRSDPRFQRIRQQILGHIAKERAELGPVKLT